MAASRQVRTLSKSWSLLERQMPRARTTQSYEDRSCDGLDAISLALRSNTIPYGCATVPATWLAISPSMLTRLAPLRSRSPLQDQTDWPLRASVRITETFTVASVA